MIYIYIYIYIYTHVFIHYLLKPDDNPWEFGLLHFRQCHINSGNFASSTGSTAETTGFAPLAGSSKWLGDLILFVLEITWIYIIQWPSDIILISRCTWDFSLQSVIDHWLIQQNPTSVGGIFSIHVVNGGSGVELGEQLWLLRNPFCLCRFLKSTSGLKDVRDVRNLMSSFGEFRGTGNIGNRDYLFVCVWKCPPPSSGNFTVFSSRKLASASWSPSCLSKVLGGLESPIAWNLILNYPSPSLPGWLVHKQFGRGSIPPLGTPSACRRRQQIREHPHLQHHCVFMPS